MPPISKNGGLIAKTTQFGYPNDKNWDRNSNVLKIGMRDNPLTPHAEALSPSLEKKFNANPGDVIETIDASGKPHYGYFGDRTSQNLSDDRVDMYQPQGFNPGIPDAQQVVDLGGGDPKLRGPALSAAGEANVARLASLPSSSVPTPPRPVSVPNAPMPANIATSQASPSPAPQPPAFPAAFMGSANLIAQNTPQMQNAPVQQRAPQANPDFLSSFYASHPVFATLGGMNA